MGEGKLVALKWLVYVATIVIAFALQTMPGFLAFGPAGVFIVIPLAVCLSMYESERSAAILGVLAGFLQAYSTGRFLGFYGAVVLACCVAAALFTMYMFRLSWFNAVLFVSGTLAILLLLDFVFYLFIWGYDGAVGVLFRQHIPTVAYSAIATPPLFWLARLYSKWFGVRREMQDF